MHLVALLYLLIFFKNKKLKLFGKDMVKPVMPHSSTKSHIDAGCGCSGDPSYKTKVVPRKKCRGFLFNAIFGSWKKSHYPNLH